MAARGITCDNRRRGAQQRPFVSRVTVLCLAMAVGLAGCTFATKPGARVGGTTGAAVGGFQEQGLIWDRVVITLNGQPAFTGRLSLVDRGGDWTTNLGGERVDIQCSTFNGFNLEVDCKLWQAGAPRAGEPWAHLRLPLL